jgi:signal transduction histidine kinase/DNA-binding response OmpR family regulator
MVVRLLILLLFSGHAFSQGITQLAGDERSISLLQAAEIHLLENDSKSLTAIQQVPFGSIKDSVIKEPYQIAWVRFSLQNTSNQPLIKKLRFFDSWCERVDIYSNSPEDRTVWLHDKAGYMMPQDSIGTGYNDENVFRSPQQIVIRLAAKQTCDYYIKYTKRYRPFLELNLNLQSVEVAAYKEVQEAKGFWSTAAFVGMLAFFASFYLLYFFIIKDVAYLYYALFGFSMIFGATVMDDYVPFYYQLLYQDNTSLQPWVYLSSGSLSIILYIQFTRSYLNSVRRYPFFDKFLKFVMAYGFVTTVIILINFAYNNRQFSPYLPFAGFMAVVGITYIIQIILIIRKGNRSDMFLLVGISLLLACLLPTQLKELFFPDDYYYKKPLINTFSVLQLGTILEMLVFALGLSYRTKQLKEKKIRLEALDKLKSKFFTDISHEFRTPLMLIKSPIERLRKGLTSKTDLQLATLAENNADKLLDMVSKILDLAKLEAEQMEIHRELVNIVSFTKRVFFSFESLAATKNISFQFQSGENTVENAVDVEKIETVLSNLITNAVKYTKTGGKITLEITKSNDGVQINLTDTGIGIPENQLDKVFDRFYQKGENQSSFGIGLALVKELVSLHNGKVSVKSTVGEGSTFTINLPIITKGHAVKARKVELEEKSPSLSKVPLPKKISHVQGKHILVVEDNDEVRQFIKLQLSEKYKVSEAVNGSEGTRMAKNIQPDLIISDVMMPNMDGYSLTQTLKTDILTSHIPIILLTAKAGQPDKNEGLSSGADAYLTKPYDLNELELRIENLIKLREELRKRFADVVQVKPTEVSVSSMDTELMEKLIAIVEKNMSNEDFSVEMLSEEVGMSSRNLNRKLQALLNTSPTDFIKTVRLQRAADLLKQNAGSIAEIAFQTGFRSAAYFSTSFKKHFGISPKNYTERT